MKYIGKIHVGIFHIGWIVNLEKFAIVKGLIFFRKSSNFSPRLKVTLSVSPNFKFKICQSSIDLNKSEF
jgi:hypothetical protein